MTNEVLCIVTDILPVSLMENDFGVGALLDQILKVLATERRVTAQKGVGDYAQGPHVYWLSVTLLQHNFRGGISKGASHGGEYFIAGVEHLGDTKISKDKVGVGVVCKVKEVLGFEIWVSVRQ